MYIPIDHMIDFIFTRNPPKYINSIFFFNPLLQIIDSHYYGLGTSTITIYIDVYKYLKKLVFFVPNYNDAGLAVRLFISIANRRPQQE